MYTVFIIRNSETKIKIILLQKRWCVSHFHYEILSIFALRNHIRNGVRKKRLVINSFTRENNKKILKYSNYSKMKFKTTFQFKNDILLFDLALQKFNISEFWMKNSYDFFFSFKCHLHVLDKVSESKKKMRSLTNFKTIKILFWC